MVVAKRAGISRQFRERPAGYSLRAPHNATSVIGDPAATAVSDFPTN